MSQVTSHAKKALPEKPNSAAASAVLQRYYFWMLRSGKITPQVRRGVLEQSVQVKAS